MVLNQIVKALNLQVLAGEEQLSQEVSAGISSDILSDVMAKAQKGCLWVTSQTHQNVVAIVYFRGLAGIIIPDSLKLDDDALARAREKGIPVMATDMVAFELIGRLYEIGVRGTK